MPVGGDDDTIAGTIAGAGVGASAAVGDALPELVASRYQIVRWLGGGGMGRVYEAHDTELDERVALKVLRAGLSEEAIERFRREVRLTRRIQHRNVARMFDIGDHAGDKFLTMELITGAPLTRELGRSMPWFRLQRLAVQLCDGLAAAHQVGVVHRDLKPDNVLIEEHTDRAVLTDFGIARSIDDPSVTQVGAVVGTPRYMAPEQLAGGATDARADLFALGVMLYEIACGARPWTGDNAIAVAVAQATQPAPPITTSRVPRAFAELVMRCLALDPDQRPASAAELGAAIAAAAPDDDGGARTPRPTLAPRGTATPPTGTATMTMAPGGTPSFATLAETTLAVLPFVSADEDAYLADGVLEDLIDTLSTTGGLRVRPAGLARSRAQPDPRELGRELGVDHVVVGTVRRTPTGLRVSARLIGVVDGFQIWAHRADCTEAEVLAVSAELARGIATALSTRATSATRATDPRAVDLYLRARAELRRYWGSHALAASELLEQAAALSPGSAPIAGALALATVQTWTMQSDPRHAERARLAVERGLASGHPEAFLAAATYRFNTGDLERGAADLGTALVRAPMLSQAHELTGRILVEIGPIAEARHHFETAAALDPTRAHILAMDLARLDALEGYWERSDRAVAALASNPDGALASLGEVFKTRLFGWRGDRSAILRGAERFAPRLGAEAGRLVRFIRSAAESGALDLTSWRSYLVGFEASDRPLRGRIMGLQLLTELALGFGHYDSAVETLERADQLGFMDLVVLDRCPLFEPLATAPQFLAVRARVADRAQRVLAAFRSTAGGG